jgi:hypothetical protein
MREIEGREEKNTLPAPNTKTIPIIIKIQSGIAPDMGMQIAY